MPLVLERRSDPKDPKGKPFSVYEVAERDPKGAFFIFPDGFVVQRDQAVALAKCSAFIPLESRPYALRITFSKEF